MALDSNDRPKLTQTELMVLNHLWGGLQRKEISAASGLALPTVKNYLDRVYAKLRVTNSVQAVRRGLEWGILRVEVKKT